jgi:hypothetical protein
VTDYLFRPPRCTPESRAGRPPRPRTEATVNNGPHVLHTGGRYPSRLVVPVLPAGDERG